MRTSMYQRWGAMLLLLCMPFALLWSQTEKGTAETVKKASSDRLVLELNYVGASALPDSMTTKWYSRGVNFYLAYDIPLGKGGHFSFSPGIGFSSHNLFNNRLFERDSSKLLAVPIDSSTTYKRNKLSANYLEVPLELRWRSAADKSGNRFKVGIGLRVGYLLNVHTKYYGTVVNDANIQYVTKIKESKLPHRNEIRFGPTLRLGYGGFNLVGFYSLTPIFKKGSAPEITTFSVGISFNSL